jgi:hypothetical protein
MSQDPHSSTDWQRLSGQYQRESPPPIGIRSPFNWWQAMIPVLALTLSFLGSYAGRAYKEGETQQKIAQQEVEIKSLREDIKEINRGHVTREYLNDRMVDLKEANTASEKRLMERLLEIKRDLR